MDEKDKELQELRRKNVALIGENAVANIIIDKLLDTSRALVLEVGDAVEKASANLKEIYEDVSRQANKQDK